MKLIASCMLLLSCLSLMMTGCSEFEGAGGGGSVHVPPASVTVGQPVTLSMELSAWGAGSGNLAKRYTAITCYYRVDASGPYHKLPMTVISADNAKMQTSCTIPGNEVHGTGIQYYIDMKFDGIYNQIKSSQDPYLIPIIGTAGSQT